MNFKRLKEMSTTTTTYGKKSIFDIDDINF
jgi:hypothetical protein